jgi:hypothetical protein
MSRFEQRHISRSDTVSDRCQWRSQRTWRPYSNNWTAASKKRKPFASNSKRKLLSVAAQIERFMEWAVQIHRTRRKQHAHVRMPTDDQTATRTDRHSAHRTASPPFLLRFGLPFRYENRTTTDGERAGLLVRGAEGKRPHLQTTSRNERVKRGNCGMQPSARNNINYANAFVSGLITVKYFGRV